MGSIVLLIAYIAVFIFQIVLLIKTAKGKVNKGWTKLFIIECISIIVSIVVYVYYNNLPGYGVMAGLSYLGEIFVTLGGTFIYLVMLFITICAKIITFEQKQKQYGKKYVSPIITIVALIFIVIGLVFLSTEIINNWGKKETVGTIVGYEQVRTGGKIENWPIISFEVNGKTFEDDYPLIEDNEIGDTLKIYYYDNYGEYAVTRYLTNNKIFYIPSFIIGILIIVFRFKKKLFDIRKN